uniref:Uncharacterized protein n=1 Tax=Rhizophora mucronata TaxID=61149 RepID=A0A2P2QJQ8_RHIMU
MVLICSLRFPDVISGWNFSVMQCWII